MMQPDTQIDRCSMQCSGFAASGSYADMIVGAAEGHEWVRGPNTAKGKINVCYPVLPLKSISMTEVRAAT